MCGAWPAYNNRSDNRYQENKRKNTETETLLKAETVKRESLVLTVERLDKEGGVGASNRFREIEQRYTVLLARVVKVETTNELLKEMAADLKRLRIDVDSILAFFPRELKPPAMAPPKG